MSPARANDLRSWVEPLVGPIIRVSGHPAAGRSRSIQIVESRRDGETILSILRSDAGDGPMSDTRFTLGREAEFLLALNEEDVRVPRCYGVSPEGTAMLLECLAGSATTSFATAEEREAVMRSYVEELAALHAIDPRTLRLPVPNGDFERSPALVDLDDFVEAYRRICPPHIEFDAVVSWLQQNAPSVRPTAVLVHGDTGPGNFMHLDGKLTGLVDFEFAHVGDREDDLAWVWFRCELLYGDLHYTDYFRWYQEITGHSIDMDRLLYYRVLVLTRCVASNLFVEGKPSDVPRAGLTKTLPWLRAVLEQAGGPVRQPMAAISDFPLMI